MNLPRLIRIIGLEDSATIRESLEEACQTRGHTYEGHEGWADFKKRYDQDREWDLMLIDSGLGISKGEELIATFRKHYQNLPPIVILSAKSEEELERIACDCGTDGYIKKQEFDDSFFDKLNEYI